MRKRDYLILADVFARQYRTALVSAANARARTDKTAEAYADGRADGLAFAADCFARECQTINSAEFLRACGLPG